MKLAVACDSAAYELKEKIISKLLSGGYEVADFGVNADEKGTDYPDYAFKACKAVLSGSCERAVLICGTGIGMSISANKLKGIRCACCSDTFSARMTRLHNDANVLAIGARVIGEGLALDIVEAFLTTDFSFEERHKKRIEKIIKIENGEML